MKCNAKVLVLFLMGSMIFAGFTGPAFAKHWKAPKAKNIIFMVPDGMGLSNTTAARIFSNGPNGPRLDFETLGHIGYQSTHSANSTVTDSAAAASAWASGDKFVNNEISCHADENGNCADQVPTILEIAAMKGKATGLVATSQISHATPAAFGAHTVSRYCGTEIAKQFIDNKIDVILGGGVYSTRSGRGCEVYDTFNVSNEDRRQYIIDLATAAGYEFVTDYAGMTAAKSKKLLGLFEQNGEGGGKTPEMFRVDETMTYPDGEPTLAEMTDKALDILEDSRRGFFLMVEGSQIDWEDHGNNMAGQIAETLGFNESVKVVLNWLDERPWRKMNTLVVVVADHDTGGFAINGPYGMLSEAGDLGQIVPGWTSGDHTAVDTIIYSRGPGSRLMDAALDNTDLYYIMKKVMR